MDRRFGSGLLEIEQEMLADCSNTIMDATVCSEVYPTSITNEIS